LTHLRQLIFRNLVKRPVRSIALCLLAAVLSAVLFAGTCTVQSLENGFRAMEMRLGADIMVVPYAAISKKNFDNAVLLGNAGAFYMPGEYMDKIARMEGVGRVSSQFCLTLTETEYCDVPVCLMAYDPETDFTVKPWILESDGDAGKSRGVVIGSRIDAKVGDTLSLFGTDVTVSARLDQSDTDCDTTVYMDPETLRSIADASGDETLKERIRGYDGNAASSILIDVKDGYDVESVKNDINIHIKKVRAVQSQHVLTHAASGMGGVSRGVKLLMAAVWAVCVGVMAAVLVFETRERRREFALLRIMGASGRKISWIVRGEVLSVSGIGALTGTLAGLILVLAGNGWMERWLSLPFLFPDAAQMAWNVLLSLLIPTVTGAAAAAFAAGRISGKEPGTLLREET